MSAFDYRVDLSREFFSYLKRYEELIKSPTHDKLFNAYVKDFYKAPKAKFGEVKSMLSMKNFKLGLLENFDRSYYEYENKSAERNWAYQTTLEREQNCKIMKYLCDKSSKTEREKTMKKLRCEIDELTTELNVISNALEDEKLLGYCKSLRESDTLYFGNRYFRGLSGMFVAYIDSHPNAEFVKKHKLTKYNFSREFFDKHLSEISALNNDKYRQM